VPEWLEWPCEEHIIVHDTSKKGSESQNYSVFTAVKAGRGLLVGSRDAASAACPVTADCDFSVFFTLQWSRITTTQYLFFLHRFEISITK
jgi:hypothetical protein